MSHIFNFQTNSGKQRGILAVYILHSLHKKPKSGYDILKEITNKTEGTWTPSKGTLYPLLSKLEEEQLIKIHKVEPRSKTIYEITKRGEKHLNFIKQQTKEIDEKINKFRSILSEIIDEEKKDMINIMLQIRKLVIQLTKTNRGKVKKILENTLHTLQTLAESEETTSK
jgi:DNA-binding PadR family transcriptional regulator